MLQSYCSLNDFGYAKAYLNNFLAALNINLFLHTVE